MVAEAKRKKTIGKDGKNKGRVSPREVKNGVPNDIEKVKKTEGRCRFR